MKTTFTLVFVILIALCTSSSLNLKGKKYNYYGRDCYDIPKGKGKTRTSDYTRGAPSECKGKETNWYVVTINEDACSINWAYGTDCHQTYTKGTSWVDSIIPLTGRWGYHCNNPYNACGQMTGGTVFGSRCCFRYRR